jgi:hypothetical protein
MVSRARCFLGIATFQFLYQKDILLIHERSGQSGQIMKYKLNSDNTLTSLEIRDTKI